MNYEAKWEAERERAAFIALDDGAVFHGVAFGARKDALGEVVFNTGMSGYQEILTDSSDALSDSIFSIVSGLHSL